MSVPTSVTLATTTVSTLNIQDITTAAVDGTGVFDVLMRSVAAQLEDQLDRGRITGTDYASVYTAAMTATLDQAIKLTFQRQLQAYDVMIKEREILKQDYELNELLPKQNLKLEKENTILDTQAAIADYELTTKLPIEMSNLTKQGNILDAQKDELDYRLVNILPVEKANMLYTGENLQAENDLLVSKLTTESKQQANIDAQTATTEAQTALYEQKTITEQAQVDGSVIEVGSAMDYQNKLLAAQTTGFTNDAVQKSAKLLIDTWNIRHTQDPSGNPPDGVNKLNDKNVGEAIETLMISAGMTPQTYP